MAQNRRQDPVAIQAYILDTEFGNLTKVDGYKKHINPAVTDKSAQVMSHSLEKTELYDNVKKNVALKVADSREDTMQKMLSNYAKAYSHLLNTTMERMDSAESNDSYKSMAELQIKSLRVPQLFTNQQHNDDNLIDTPHQNYDATGIIE